MPGKIILLNAPKLAGKDTIANGLCRTYSYYKLQFKERLFRIAASLCGMCIDEFMNLYNDRFYKENPCPEFLGYSGRQLLIEISENFCKPKFGIDYFGKAAAQEISSDVLKETNYVFSDSGFIEEVVPLANIFGAENIRIIRFVRPGFDSWEGDSRYFVDGTPFGIQTSEILINDDHPQNFVDFIHKTYG